ncbi:hypothetical protein GCM10007216_29770 [Thalassobacillus devorans]|uniref:Uncharacterized protein n=1 Tax=Thalassobacillus devorans TaxID=279813 RepID=A0ABQ1PGM7_9BACI|nr:hypothetical protein [Thalassobacillus devorans]NIK29481.1 hypothetical protein [Thalassobacillus devorans]GGC97000.1 hypothetical protein GCM10007216_29770 [Thalassobacillus devorans]
MGTYLLKGIGQMLLIVFGGIFLWNLIRYGNLYFVELGMAIVGLLLYVWGRKRAVKKKGNQPQ